MENWDKGDCAIIWTVLGTRECPPDSVLKQEFFGIQGSTFFRVNKFSNIWGIKVIFFIKCAKFNVDFKNEKNISKLFSVFNKIAFELVAGFSLSYEQSTCDQASMF